QATLPSVGSRGRKRFVARTSGQAQVGLALPRSTQMTDCRAVPPGIGSSLFRATFAFSRQIWHSNDKQGWTAPRAAGVEMNDQLICTWLGITDAAWPPDHYRLLGLPMGEPNIERIEEQVHRRLESVRRYQLTHPEIVTEAMNRLAQAFVCLTDPAA